jgi:hypothetical protein
MNVAAPQFIQAFKSYFVLNNGNHVRVVGYSMWPSIKNNQKVKISYQIAVLKPGCCYAFFNKNRTIVHRFVHLKKDKAIFIGDRSNSCEEINPDCVIGKVVIQQGALIIWIIAAINFIFINFHIPFKTGNILRIALIEVLTIGAIYARKLRKTGDFNAKNGNECTSRYLQK